MFLDCHILQLPSPSVVEKVRHYILHQEEHHCIKTFSQEYEEFIKNSLVDDEKG